MTVLAFIIGVVVLALTVSGYQSSADHHIPLWVLVMSAVVISLGTYSGGWRIMRTLGRGIIHLDPPQGFAAELLRRAHAGAQDATDPCASITQTQDADGTAVITALATGLQPYQTLTMAVGFAPDTFTLFDTGYFASPFGWVQALAGLGAVGAGVVAVRARRRQLADEPGRPTIIAEYEPPRAIDALESAVLLGHATKAIPAEVLEQAVAGSIRIIEGKKGMWGKAKLTAELVDASRADGDGRMLLDGLFPKGVPGEQYTFGTQDTRLSKVAQGILAAAATELQTRGLRRPVPAAVRVWPSAARSCCSTTRRGCAVRPAGSTSSR